MSMMTPEVKIAVAEGYGFPLPAYETDGAAGMDLRLFVPGTERGIGTILIRPGDVALAPTGIRLEIPAGFEAQIRPRSGLALKHGITVLNSPGTIDSDYRGEVKVLLHNVCAAPCFIESGERIAQMVFAPVARAHLVRVDDLGGTPRGEGGFGSTGTS